MNNIVSLRTEVKAKDAEIESLRQSLHAIRAKGLAGGYVSEAGNAGYVNGADVAHMAEQAGTAANAAYSEAWYAEVGPPVADGSHYSRRGERALQLCSHGGRTVNGYHCPECGEALPGDYNDTDAKAADRMLSHWRTVHRPEAN